MPPLTKMFVPVAFAAGGILVAGPMDAQSTDPPSTTVVVAARDTSGDSARRPAGTPTKYGTGVRTAKGARFWPGGGGGGVVDVTADAPDGERSRFRTQAGGAPQVGGEGGEAATGDGGVQEGGQSAPGIAAGVGGARVGGEGVAAGQSTFTPIDYGSPTYLPGGFDAGGSAPVPFSPVGVAPYVTPGRGAAAVPAAPRQPVYVEPSYSAPAYGGPGAVVVPILPFDNSSTTGRAFTGIRNPISRRRTSTFGSRGPKPQAEAFGHERGGEVYIDPGAVILRNGPPLEGVDSTPNLFEGWANP